MDWVHVIEFGLAILGGLGVILSYFRIDHAFVKGKMADAHSSEKPTVREKLMAIFAVFSLLLSGIGLYTIGHQPPGPLINPITMWGTTQQGGSLVGYVVVDGNLINQTTAESKVSVVMLHYDGRTDILDAGSLQKSALYDLQRGPIQIVIPLDAAFIKANTLGVATNYLVLLVPNGVSPEFTTLRQAKALGIKIINANI